MGRAKAWLPWFGKTMVEHVVGVLQTVVDEVVVVTSADLDLPALGMDVRIVRDREAERGPLAGLREGFEAASADATFVTGTDAPFLGSAFVEEMFARGGACAPLSDGHVQVLCAVYGPGAAEKAQALLTAGKSRPRDLLESQGYQAIAAEELVSPPSRAPWEGFNTPEAYLSAIRSVDAKATCVVELLGRAAKQAQKLGADSTREVPVGTLGDLLGTWPEKLGLVDEGRVAKRYLASLGGRDLVRDLAIPVGPGERISMIDALAGG